MRRLSLFPTLLALAVGACGKAPLDRDPGGDAGAPAVSARWIYVATARGIERVAPAGGPFEAFGAPDDTIGVLPSPNRGLVAQVLASRYAGLFDDKGASRGAIDVNSAVLGWSDDQTLIAHWESGGKLIQFDLRGQAHDLDVPAAFAALDRVSASPRGRWLAAVGTRQAPRTEQDLVLLSPVDGSLVADLGPTSAQRFAWTGDERLAFAAPDGVSLEVVNPGTRDRRVIPLTGVDLACGLSSWYGPGRVVGGSDDVGAKPCQPILIDVEGGGTSPLTTPFSNAANPAFAFSPDGSDVAAATTDELFVGRVGGSFRSLGRARAFIVAVGW